MKGLLCMTIGAAMAYRWQAAVGFADGGNSRADNQPPIEVHRRINDAAWAELFT
jgi:hypothetical protein